MNPDADWPAARNAVQNRMKELKIGTERLARVTGLSPTTIRYFGRRPATPLTVNQINTKLGFPDDYLFAILRGESPEPVEPPDTLHERLIRVEQKLDELLELGASVPR